jgi:hypothetical protein
VVLLIACGLSRTPNCPIMGRKWDSYTAQRRPLPGQQAMVRCTTNVRKWDSHLSGCAAT